MIAALSDRWRWGVSVGESLGHHKGNRNIGRRGDELAGMGLMAAAPCRVLKRSTRRDNIALTRRSTERDSAPMSEGTVILALGFPFSGAPILRRA